MNIKKFLGIILVNTILFSNVNAGIFISEIMPNTTDDTNLEYIELYNSNVFIESLSGYILKDKSEKAFVFGSGFYINSMEKIKFFRNDTKILLNNTSEEIYLYDNNGNLIDKFSYETSEKGEKISKEIIEEIIKNEEQESGAFETLIGEIEIHTGVLDEFTGSLDKIPEIETITGILDKTGELETITGEIEINTGVLDEFTGSLDEVGNIENLTGILNQTGSIEILTGEIDINTGILHEFTGSLNEILKIENFSISEKESNNFFIKPIEQNNIATPKIVIQSGIGEDSLCKKNDCKVNLLYENKNSNLLCEWDFDGGAITTIGTDSKCNPGFVSYKLGDYKVKLKVYQKDFNSNYKETYLYFSNKLIVEENAHKIVASNNELEEIELESETIDEILEEDNTYTGEIILDNYMYGIYDYKNKSEIKKFDTYLQKSFSIGYKKLKSGLKIYGKTIPNVEVIISFKEKKELSILDFFIYSTYADNLYITNSDNNGNYEILIKDFLSGNFELNSKIIDIYQNTIKINKTKEITIDENYSYQVKKYIGEQNLKQVKKYLDSLNKKEKNNIEIEEKDNKIITEELKSKIELQGKIGKNKKLEGNTLYCYNTCSVNFNGSKSEGSIKKYLWNFGNGETFEGKNPGYIKYKNFGDYKVILSIYGENGDVLTGEFFIKFYKKAKIKKLKKDTSINKNLIINKSEAGIGDKNINQNQNFNGILSYLIIMLIAIFLLFIILRKEKLI